MRLIFMGTPEFAVPALLEIVGRGYEVAAVYTAAPKPAGRGMEKKPGAVEREARRFGLPVLTPETLRTPEAAEGFRAHGAEAAVVVAYGLILPKPILEAVPLGCFNLHASLLPRWRGAAPIHRAILAGDTETGVALAPKIENRETRIDWARPWKAVHDHCRGLSPVPGAWFELEQAGEAMRIKVLRTTRGEGGGPPGTLLSGGFDVACADGAVRILELQRAGRQPMRAEAFLRGTKIAPGAKLG